MRKSVQRSLTMKWVAPGLFLAACSGGGGTSSYYAGAASQALGAPMNEASCATCHSNRTGAPGYSGDSLENSAYRTSYKGGGAPTLLDAANACITGWMGGEALTPTDPEWAALESELRAMSDPSVTAPAPLAPEVLANEAAYETAYAGGDATRGSAAYALYCARCHDEGLIVGRAPAYPRSALASFSIGRIARKVRTSGPPPSGMGDTSDATPGPMPFFEPEELSASDLRDIIAFVRGG